MKTTRWIDCIRRGCHLGRGVGESLKNSGSGNKGFRWSVIRSNTFCIKLSGNKTGAQFSWTNTINSLQCTSKGY